jgi:putative PEP-CTERM system TPR-repeat lipoprotein
VTKSRSDYEYMEQNMKLQFKIIPLVVALALLGCNKQTAEELIVQAQTRLTENETSGAIIDLKNAIQKAPDNAQARFLLGKMYVEKGAAASAEKELSSALKFGYDKNIILPLLSKSFSLQFKNQHVIDLVNEFKDLEPVAKTSLLFYQAIAYYQIDRPLKARESIKIANEISTDSIYSQVGNVYLDFSNKKIDSALTKINIIIERNPKFDEAFLLKGQLETIQQDTAAAVSSFEKYNELLPHIIHSQLYLANAYIKNRQFNKAESLIDRLLENNENLSFLNELKGLLRYQAKDFQNAKLYTDRAIHGGLDTAPNRIIAGISSLKLENFEQAFKNLELIQDILPTAHPVRKLYAMVAFNLGHSIAASESITQSVTLTEDDIMFLSKTTAKLLREGKRKEALAISHKTNSIDFSNPLRIAQKGMLRLSLKDLDGIADLEKAISMDPNLESVNAALAQVLLVNRLYDDAVELSSKWIVKHPNRVNGYVLAALAYRGLNNITETESMFQKALALDRINPAANLYFSEKAVMNGDKKAALSFLQTIISAYPTYALALKRYFVLKNDLGLAEEGLALIKKALEENPKAERLNLLLGQAFYTSGNFTESISILEGMERSDRLPDVFWIALGNAYYLSGQKDKVLSTSEDWIYTSPASKNAYLQSITYNEKFNDFSEALNISKRAQSKFIDDEQFRVLTVHLNVLLEQPKAALKAYELLPEKIKESTIGKGLIGQILLETGDFKDALDKLEAFYQLSSSNRNATFVAKTLKNLNREQDAITFLEKHLEKEKNQDNVRLQIAELAIGINQFQTAKIQYLQILNSDNQNVIALNNLANIFIELGNLNDAEKYAGKASALLPNNAAILDTYASTLLLNGKFKDAADVAEKAFNIDQKDIEIGMQYSQALISSGNKAKARIILNKLDTTDIVLKEKILELKSKTVI